MGFVGTDLEHSSDHLAQVLRELGLVRREQGDFARADALFEEGLKLDRTSGDRAVVALALLGRADVARDRGDAVRVREYGEESLAILRELGMEWAIGFTLNTLAQAAFLDHDLPQAFALISESAALFRSLKNDGGLAEVLVTMGHIQRAQGDVAAAREALTESLRLASTYGPRLLVANALDGLASAEISSGQAALVAQLLSVTRTLRAEMGTPVRPVDQPELNRTLATARSILGDETFNAIRAEALSLEDILTTIFGEVPANKSSAPVVDFASTCADEGEWQFGASSGVCGAQAASRLERRAERPHLLRTREGTRAADRMGGRGTLSGRKSTRTRRHREVGTFGQPDASGRRAFRCRDLAQPA